MYKDENEIYHHGILGQKWGVRRYQNPDGSLTEAGRRRAQKLKGEYESLTRKKLKFGKDRLLRRSDYVRNNHNKDLSDIDLDYKINRLQREKQARDLEAYLNPSKENKGRSLLKESWNDVVKPVLKDRAKSWFNDYLTPEKELSVYEKASREAKYQQDLFNAGSNKFKRENQLWLKGDKPNSKDFVRVNITNANADWFKKAGNKATSVVKDYATTTLNNVSTSILNAGKRKVDNFINKLTDVKNDVVYKSTNMAEGFKNSTKYSVEKYFKAADKLLTNPTTSSKVVNDWMPDWLKEGRIVD